jgi:hypothetical protein
MIPSINLGNFNLIFSFSHVNSNQFSKKYMF